jgi:hypothetical protein
MRTQPRLDQAVIDELTETIKSLRPKTRKDYHNQLDKAQEQLTNYGTLTEGIYDWLSTNCRYNGLVLPRIRQDELFHLDENYYLNTGLPVPKSELKPNGYDLPLANKSKKEPKTSKHINSLQKMKYENQIKALKEGLAATRDFLAAYVAANPTAPDLGHLETAIEGIVLLVEGK